MPSLAFDGLQSAEFAGFKYPVSEITVTGGLRDHVHEYPHSPGGAPEKLGRKLYEFRMRCPFQQGLRGFPLCWPETLQSLRIIFEGGGTFDLVVPTVGTIQAYCVSWVETANFQRNRQGVEVELVFREDDSNLFLVTELITQTTANFGGVVANYKQALADQVAGPADAAALLTAPDSLMLVKIPGGELATFNQILSDASAVLSAVDTVLEVGSAVVGLALGLVALCEQADATSSALQDPTRAPFLAAFLAVWAGAQKVAKDAQRLDVTVVEYVVPQPGLGVGAVSTAIYGDASHIIEILTSNQAANDNPFLIPGGTVIKAYRFNNASAVAAAS